MAPVRVRPPLTTNQWIRRPLATEPASWACRTSRGTTGGWWRRATLSCAWNMVMTWTCSLTRGQSPVLTSLNHSHSRSRSVTHSHSRFSLDVKSPVLAVSSTHTSLTWSGLTRPDQSHAESHLRSDTRDLDVQSHSVTWTCSLIPLILYQGCKRSICAS